MEHIGKRHKIIPIPWACLVFPLASFTVDLVGTNIEKCDMKFVTATFAPTSRGSDVTFKKPTYNLRSPDEIVLEG